MTQRLKSRVHEGWSEGTDLSDAAHFAERVAAQAEVLLIPVRESCTGWSTDTVQVVQAAIGGEFLQRRETTVQKGQSTAKSENRTGIKQNYPPDTDGHSQCLKPSFKGTLSACGVSGEHSEGIWEQNRRIKITTKLGIYLAHFLTYLHSKNPSNKQTEPPASKPWKQLLIIIGEEENRSWIAQVGCCYLGSITWN